MDNETIPPEVVEAAAIADFKAWREYHNRTEEWGDLLPEEQESYRVAARAAIAAALNAWSGMRLMEEQHSKTIQWVPWRIKEWKYRFLHLPLPKENSDD